MKILTKDGEYTYFYIYFSFIYIPSVYIKMMHNMNNGWIKNA